VVTASSTKLSLLNFKIKIYFQKLKYCSDIAVLRARMFHAVTGYDGIPSKISKVCASQISYPLTHIYNHSLLTGIFPNHLQVSIVRPLYKKGDKTTMSNYRPISLLTTFSKILEKVMHNRLSHYLQINNILVPEQSGLRKGISAENAAFKLTDSVLKSLNPKMRVGGIFCDWLKPSIV
jgi:hypothetical protein